MHKEKLRNRSRVKRTASVEGWLTFQQGMAVKTTDLPKYVNSTYLGTYRISILPTLGHVDPQG